jgi:hypothetical protein
VVRPLPVEGNAGVVLAISRGLGDQAARLTATTRALEGVSRTMAQDWDSPAGAAFAAHAGAVLPVVSRIATRYAAAAAAVHPVAEALHAAQATSTEALAEWDDAWPRFLAASEAMAASQGSADPARQAQAAGHRAVMLAQHERCARAERRNAAAHELWQQADERCAVVLRHLVRDGLADPWAYDALTTTSREARGVGEAVDLLGPAPLLPPLKWLDVVGTAGDAVALVADTAMLVGYHQGGATALTLRAASLATGPLSGVLKRGARATNPAARLMAPVRTRAEARARRRMPLLERIKAGAREEYDHRVRGVPDPLPRHRVPLTAPPRTLAGAAAWAKMQAKARAAAYARNAFLDDWALASRGVPEARRMLVAAWTVDKAGDPLARGADHVAAELEPADPVAGSADGTHRDAGHPGPTR